MRSCSPRILAGLSLLLVCAPLTPATGASGTPASLRTSRIATMDLETGFRTPPAEAKPRVYWWWLNSQVTEAAITRDLEEMAAKGIGGALLFDAGGGKDVPPGPPFLGDEWRALFRHAVREAGRLGVELSVNLSSGWDCGGPWIPPEHACRRVATSRLGVRGPRTLVRELDRPAGEDYRDIAVLALPASGPGPGAPRPRVTASSSQAAYPAARVVDGDANSFWVSDGWKVGDGPTAERPEWLQFDFPEPVTTRVMQIIPRPRFGPRRVEVQVARGDGELQTVQAHELRGAEASRPAVVRFPEVTSTRFRLVITSAYSFGSAEASWNVQIREVTFDESTLWEDRGVLAASTPARYLTGAMGEHAPSYVAPMEPARGGEVAGAVPAAAVVDLTDRVDAAGRLGWEVPAGDWTILRLGHAAAGYRTHCSSEGGGGLEVDWLSAEATELHFAATAAKLIEDAGPLAGSTLRFFHDDSWEVGVPNWTGGFVEAFAHRRGYDPTHYLPVLAGQVVGSREVSERFLYDYRRTIADLLAEDHYERMCELCHRHGVLFHSEGGGPCTRIAPMDALRNLGMNDVPMGEFWQYGEWTDGGQNIVGKQTAAAAHIHGKRFVAAEAFTSMRRPHWQEGPAEMKPIADLAFCEGINRFFHHTFTCSPEEFGRPGIEYFAGTHFNPNVTWWEQAGALELYIARCQFLLSQGLFVADVCFYYGDHAPNFVGPRHVPATLGPGYDYDVCDAEVLLRRMSVRDGRIVLPDGMSYRVLVLPERETMPLAVLRKVKELVVAGATVVGPRPDRAPGLRDHPRSDEEVRRLAAELWGGDGEGDGGGGGRVIHGRSVREVLAERGVAPDFEHASGGEGASLDSIHRSVEGAEVYFVANRKEQGEEVDCTFRVAGRQGELWNPVTGEIRRATSFRVGGGRTTIPLRFAPYGSWFVVFRRETAGGESPESGRPNWPAEGESYELSGPWTVAFDRAWGGPESVRFDRLVDWTKRPEPGIRHYSGTARYTKTFALPAPVLEAPVRLELDLGVVRNVAEVRLNGHDLGVVWTAPWRVDITDAVRPAGNRLEITVVNLWPNRLIGDAGLPEEERLTRTNQRAFDVQGRDPVRADSPLLRSGLLGPVTVRSLR